MRLSLYLLLQSKAHNREGHSYSLSAPLPNFIPLISDEPSTSSGFKGTDKRRNNDFWSRLNRQNKPNIGGNNPINANSSHKQNAVTLTKIKRDSIDSNNSDVIEVPSTSKSTDKDIQEISAVGSSTILAEDIDLIADAVKLDRPIVQNVLHLLEDECTVPFIVRYRQSYVRSIDADKVRLINTVYNELKEARERAKDVESCLKKQNRLSIRLQIALKRCKTVYEVENLYRLSCNESEDCERAKNLGLADSAYDLLNGKRLDPQFFVKRYAMGMSFKGFDFI